MPNLNKDVIIDASNQITEHQNQLLMDVASAKDVTLTEEQRNALLDNALSHLNGERSIEQANQIIRREWDSPTGKD